MSGTAFPSTVSQVDTTARFPLGYEVTLPATKSGTGGVTNNAGPRTGVYVFNDAASAAFAAGNIIYRDPSATTHDWYGGLLTPVDVHQPKVLVLGVAQHAIAAGSYGFILQKGVGTIMAGTAALTLDTAFTSGGADNVGRAIDYADAANQENVAVIGHTAAGIAGDATGTAYINCG